MSDRQRPRFQCWNCKRKFHQTVKIGDDPVLLLECPFCGAMAKADLDPYRQRTDRVMRSGGPGIPASELNLPDPIPTESRD